MREVKRRNAKKNNSDVWLVASFSGFVDGLRVVVRRVTAYLTPEGRSLVVSSGRLSGANLPTTFQWPSISIVP